MDPKGVVRGSNGPCQALKLLILWAIPFNDRNCILIVAIMQFVSLNLRVEAIAVRQAKGLILLFLEPGGHLPGRSCLKVQL
jgi:hypothetical protein